MNFAVAGSGVLEVPEKVATLSKQVDNFEGLVKDRTFPPWRLRFSLALVAISGNDYARIVANMSSNDVSHASTYIYIRRAALLHYLRKFRRAYDCRPWL